MKFTHSFAAFLKNTVNVNQTRVTQADSAFDTLTSFVKNAAETKDIFKTSTRQGSLRQGTIIRPRTNETEFDVDMLVDVKDVSDWKAANYLDAFHKAFKNSDRYKDIVDRRGKTRCVTIDYATNDFHVDIVPSVERSGQCYIMNRKTNQFELTDGDGYAAWFSGRNDITGGAELVRVVRLCKYLRDEHDWPVKSILLTTLLGLQVYNGDGSVKFADTPTALVTLLSRTDTWLQAQTQVPQVANPALPSEKFTRHWHATPKTSTTWSAISGANTVTAMLGVLNVGVDVPTMRPEASLSGSVRADQFADAVYAIGVGRCSSSFCHILRPDILDFGP